MNDDIKKMLRIIDKNLEITKVSYETYRNVTARLYCAVIAK